MYLFVFPALAMLIPLLPVRGGKRIDVCGTGRLRSAAIRTELTTQLSRQHHDPLVSGHAVW